MGWNGTILGSMGRRGVIYYGEGLSNVGHYGMVWDSRGALWDSIGHYGIV